ncbi:MAG: PCRF domain-containing protein, partial [Candidatus Dormibacteraeota bacterium]|nr:PCRF domain-containing protein [Candidatus Dormibacteraeota bacterium]
MAGIEERLQALASRYHELETELARPEVYQDHGQVQRLSQEQAKLRDVVETGRRWQDAERAAREAAEMAQHERDPEVVALAEDEERTQRAAAAGAYEQLRALLLPTDPNDDRDVVVEIRAGTGGDEAALFAADLFRMYARYAERQRWGTEVIDTNETA